MWRLKHANPGAGNHLPQIEANKTAIFVQCLAEMIQRWRRPGYFCSVTMFLQLYLFDFKMPEFEFIHLIHSFFHSTNSRAHLNQSLAPSFLVVRYSSCIFNDTCTSAVVEDPFIFKIICTENRAAVTHSKLLVTLFMDTEEGSFQQIGRILKEFIFFWHKDSTWRHKEIFPLSNKRSSS